MYIEYKPYLSIYIPWKLEIKSIEYFTIYAIIPKLTKEQYHSNIKIAVLNMNLNFWQIASWSESCLSLTCTKNDGSQFQIYSSLP